MAHEGDRLQLTILIEQHEEKIAQLKELRDTLGGPLDGPDPEPTPEPEPAPEPKPVEEPKAEEPPAEEPAPKRTRKRAPANKKA